MNARIHNRDGKAPADHWYQIEVKGTWPAGVDANGKPRRQLIDDKAIASILNRFNEEKETAGVNFSGLLVDLDHLSHDLANSTEAFAWAQELGIRNGQLHARLDLTDLGEPAIKNKRVKFFSTEYDPEDLEQVSEGVVRPLRLGGLAFTNRPNNRGAKPISNRQEKPPVGEPTPTETKTTMKPIAEALGLPAEADEAAILAAIAKLNSKVKDSEAKDNEAQAEAILNSIGKNIPATARAHWKQQLILNREDAKKGIELSFPAAAAAAAGRERIHNREGASSPEPVESQGTPAADATATKKAAAIRNRASDIQRSQNLPFNRAFALAQAELS